MRFFNDEQYIDYIASGTYNEITIGTNRIEKIENEQITMWNMQERGKSANY